MGAHDDHVWKMSRHEVGPAQMLRGGQVLCGTNATRRWLNTAMKCAAGFDADYPTGHGEEIICLKNRHDLGLINGMFLTLSDVRQDADDAFALTAMVETEDGESIAGRQSFWRGEYADHVAYDPRARAPRMADQARAHREQLGLRHHLPYGAGQPTPHSRRRG